MDKEPTSNASQQELFSYIELLKAELGKAMFCRALTRTRCVEVDPSGNTYEIDWTESARKWAILAGIDLSEHDPSMFS